MKYMLLIHLDEKAWAELGPERREQIMADSRPHVERLRAEGKFLDGCPLAPSSTGTILRLRDGKPVVTDGPYAETREQVGGYSLIEAGSQEEVVAMAKSFLGSRSIATIEVRRLADTREPEKSS